MSSIQEDAEGEKEEDEGLPTYPYERLTTTSDDPAPDIDLTRREVRLCPLIKHFQSTAPATHMHPKVFF